MREMLEPMFGSWGAVVAQFLITVIVVLFLIAVLYWLVRRYSGIRLGGIGRGRVPRLAVVDALAIDGRRRLILVRRDNVEHLLLIGGTSDVVVEPAIQRPRLRQPAAAPGQQAAPALPQQPPPAVEAVVPPLPAEPPAPSEPIPFPRLTERPDAGQRVTIRPLPRPAMPPPPPPRAEPAPPPDPREAARALVAGTAAPSWDEPGDGAAGFRPPAPREEIAEALPPEIVSAVEEAAPRLPPLPAAASAALADDLSEFSQPALDLGEEEAPATAANGFAEAQPPADEDTAAKVGDLEREMARLLGAFQAKRPP